MSKIFSLNRYTKHGHYEASSYDRDNEDDYTDDADLRPYMDKYCFSGFDSGPNSFYRYDSYLFHSHSPCL